MKNILIVGPSGQDVIIYIFCTETKEVDLNVMMMHNYFEFADMMGPDSLFVIEDKSPIFTEIFKGHLLENDFTFVVNNTDQLDLTFEKYNTDFYKNMIKSAVNNPLS